MTTQNTPGNTPSSQQQENGQPGEKIERLINNVFSHHLSFTMTSDARAELAEMRDTISHGESRNTTLMMQISDMWKQLAAKDKEIERLRKIEVAAKELVGDNCAACMSAFVATHPGASPSCEQCSRYNLKAALAGKE